MLGNFKNTTFGDLKLGDVFTIPSHSTTRYAKIFASSDCAALNLKNYSLVRGIYSDDEVLQIVGKKITYGVKEQK